MSSLNKSVIQEWHKYRNIVSHFSSVMGHINIKKPLKNWQKLSNASYASIFSFVAPDFVWSFQKRNWKANPKTLELKRNYLERNQAYNQILRSVSLSILKYKTSKITGNRTNICKYIYIVDIWLIKRLSKAFTNKV